MKLLLTSNGLEGNIPDILPQILKKPIQDNAVAFITTSAYGEGDDISWLEKYKEELIHAGFKNIEDVDIRNKTQEQLEKIFADKDVIFMNGGNTFFLLHYVKETGFENVLKKFLNEGKLYIGASAGSIICTPSIENATWEPEPDINRIGLTDLQGLHFVDFLIAPHVDETNKVAIQESASKSSYPTKLLTNSQAILVENGETKIIE